MVRRRLLTERLEIRPWTGRDFPRWAASNRVRPPARTRWDSEPLAPERITRETFEAMRERHRKGAEADRHYVYGLVTRDGGRAVGAVDLFVLVREDRQVANLGWLVEPAYRGRGLATEAARGALRIGFEHLGLQRIEASVDPDHAASIRVAEAAGMRARGLERGYLFEAGAWIDQLVFVANPWDLGLPCRPPRSG